MKISPYGINKITPYIVNAKSGKEIVELFNKFGNRDIYDKLGLPDIGKANGSRPSKTEYINTRLTELNDSQNLRYLLKNFVNENKTTVEEINLILNPEGYGIEEREGDFIIEGGIIDTLEPVKNEAHFRDIQAQILKALDDAKVSITVVMAWFTNDTLFKKLLEKQKEGIEVKLAIYDDGINRKFGVDISQIPHTKLKRGTRGGLMHNKFCVIDNQVVITGSYNWSDNAEFKNDENITVEYDPKQASKYSVEYRNLISK